jgi:hypothetical protein
MQRDFDNIKDSDRLSDIYGEWLVANDFDESLPVEHLRHAHGAELTNSQREWLDDFEAAWHRAVVFEDKVLKLSKAFSRVLRDWLTVEQMVAVVQRNRAQDNPNVCHSHDFCDANMAMDEAFTKVVGRECEGEDPETGEEPEDFELWNAAWSLAKRNEFTVR